MVNVVTPLTEALYWYYDMTNWLLELCSCFNFKTVPPGKVGRGKDGEKVTAYGAERILNEGKEIMYWLDEKIAGIFLQGGDATARFAYDKENDHATIENLPASYLLHRFVKTYNGLRADYQRAYQWEIKADRLLDAREKSEISKLLKGSLPEELFDNVKAHINIGKTLVLEVDQNTREALKDIVDPLRQYSQQSDDDFSSDEDSDSSDSESDDGMVDDVSEFKGRRDARKAAKKVHLSGKQSSNKATTFLSSSDTSPLRLAGEEAQEEDS